MNENNFAGNLTDDELDELISKMCSARKENPDVQILDNVYSDQRYINNNPILQERIDISNDRKAIDDDILKGLFETETPLSVEELNILKAKGLYDKYIEKFQNNTQEENVMHSIEDEIRQNLAATEEVVVETKPIEEPVVVEEEHFRESESISEDINPNEVIDIEVNPENTEEAAEVISEVVEDDDYHEMSVEEINDVPATELTVDSNALKETVMEQYSDVDEKEALQLIDVMNRYKSGEKFKVFDALPVSIKNAIASEALSNGADRNLMEYFAKSFINGLVSDAYIDKEIKDFNAELKEVLEPLNNVTETLMDEYSDDVYDKFTRGLEEQAQKKIEEGDLKKADELNEISTSFKEATSLTRIINEITEKPSRINFYYKMARDNFTAVKRDYYNNLNKAELNPVPRDFDSIYFGLNSTEARNYGEDILNTIAVMVMKSINAAIEAGTLSEHVYAYYMSNAVYVVSFGKKSISISYTIEAINKLAEEINTYMAPLLARNSKKNRKRRK